MTISVCPAQITLTGADLLARVKELGDASKSDLVRACGYVSTKKDGTERLNYTAFYEALLQAKGMDVGGKIGSAKGGRKLSFNAKVQFNGNLMVGKAYTALLDLKPGDEFEIKLGRRAITLTPVSVTARKDDASAAHQAALTKVAGRGLFSEGGGLIHTTSG